MQRYSVSCESKTSPELSCRNQISNKSSKLTPRHPEAYFLWLSRIRTPCGVRESGKTEVSMSDCLVLDTGVYESWFCIDDKSLNRQEACLVHLHLGDANT